MPVSGFLQHANRRWRRGEAYFFLCIPTTDQNLLLKLKGIEELPFQRNFFLHQKLVLSARLTESLSDQGERTLVPNLTFGQDGCSLLFLPCRASAQRRSVVFI